MQKYLLISFLIFIAFGNTLRAQCPTTPPIISGPTNVCAGTSAQYYCYTSANLLNLVWAINGGGNAYIIPPASTNVYWTIPGTWQISVSISGCSSTPIAVYNINVVNSTTISAPTQITGSSGICNGGTAIYSIPQISGLTPIWRIEAGLPSTALPILTTNGNQASVAFSAFRYFYTLGILYKWYLLRIRNFYNN
jgi:hypothetical protein